MYDSYVYNPYQVLQVDVSCSKDEIKASYKRLSKLYHPDNIDTGDAEKFQEVKFAWEYLNTHHVDFKDKSIYIHKTLFTIKKL